MKKLLKIVLWIVGIVVALVLALPLWIGPVVKTAANAIVPKKTGTSFNLGLFGLNPYTGKLAIGDVQLWNPEGFSQKMAVTLGSLNAELDVASLTGDPIIIRDVALKDVFISYDVNGNGESNFAVIKQNAAGEEVDEKGGRRKVEGGTKEVSTSSVQPPTSNLQPSSSASKKVIIDHLLIQNVMVQLGPIPIPMNIELTGIGRKSNGVTMQEAWEQIYAQVLQNLNSLGINVNGLGNAELGKALMAVGAAGDLSKKEGRKRAVKNLVDAFLAGAVEVGDAAGQAKGSVGDGTKQAGGAVGDATKDTTDAVGEQADKAVNAIKGLFR